VDERHRIPVDPEYAQALGRAAYCFAYCEWAAVWCAERLQDGYIGTIEEEKKTAGRIARELQCRANEANEAALRKELAEAADRFKNLTDERNDLFHAKPCTAEDGAQRLSGRTGKWTPEDIRDFANRVALCAITLNGILHERLGCSRQGHDRRDGASPSGLSS